MSVADVSPTSSLKVSPQIRRPRRSLSNRFSSLLSPKSSHTSSFSIDLDHPLKTYGPGDAVKGKVVLDIARPLGVTHIVVSLHGSVQVFKNHAKSKAGHPSSGSRAAAGRGKRWVSEYHGDGFMSLFEEEIVLCGEGRLDPTYSPFHFHFNLEFPSELALPSSVDFERGTIAYMVTATMTRPAYTAPTMSYDTRVAFLEDIDIAALPSPKPREVTLRPEHRSGSPRSSLKRLTSYDVKRAHRASTVSTPQPSSKSVLESAPSNIESTPVRPPSVSVASTHSSSSGHNRVSAAPSEPRSSHTSSSLNGEPHRIRNITASAELCKSGCLPGQLVPLLVKVNHNKVVRNPAGILVTLYRQARVDMHPHLPLASNEKGTNTRYEDYYPRSRTGLGGLSLSAAGSSQVWRKDLSQTTAPLYIHPQTMSQEIKVAVRVPELPGAFPSVRNVPGQMISFKYIVEVILDIHGKLIGHDRVMSASGVSEGSQQPYHIDGSLVSDGGDRTQSTTYEARCMDTTQLRRDKHAVTMECELVVGTRNSEGGKGKQKEIRKDSEPSSEAQMALEGPTAPLRGHEETMQDPGSAPRDQMAPEDSYEWLSRWDDYGQRWLFIDEWGNVYDEDWNFLGHDYAYETEQGQETYNEPSTLVAPPDFANEQELPEKERLRRAEESLLPSQPPVEGQASRPAVDVGPTAPSLPEEDFLHATDQGPAGPSVQQASSPVVQDFASVASTQPEAPVPSYYREDSSSRGATGAEGARPVVTDDKHELELRRLQGEASGPDDAESAEIRPAEASAPSPEAAVVEAEADAATAPTLPANEADEPTGRALAEQSGEEALPQYQRY